MLASLGHGESRILNPSSGKDAVSTVDCLKACGIPIVQEPWGFRVDGAHFSNPSSFLNCGNSGTTARLLAGLLCGQGVKATLIGDTSLSSRPMARVMDPLTEMGANLESKTQKLPLTILAGELKGISYQLPVPSAQVKSCILLAGLGAEGDTTVVDPFHTRDHTERMYKALGVPFESRGSILTTRKLQKPIEPFEYHLPGDFSSAAFFIALATILPRSELLIRNVLLNERRIGFFRVLERMGAELEILSEEIIHGERRGDIRVWGVKELQAFQISGKEAVDLLDEVPLLSVLGALAVGESKIEGAEELRVKESDRLQAMTSNLRHLGVKVVERPDGFRIKGPVKLHGGKVASYHDHRIAMSMIVADLVCDGNVQIDDTSCVDISCPEFISLLSALLV